MTEETKPDKTRPQYHPAPRTHPFPDPLFAKHEGGFLIQLPSRATYDMRPDGWRRVKWED